jgi:hypothetical protein
MVIQAGTPLAVQAQPVAQVTLTLPLDDTAEKEALLAERA